MDCDVCYNSFKPHQLVQNGCCTFKACRPCVARFTAQQCPMCKRDFCVDRRTPTKLLSEIKTLKAEIKALKCKDSIAEVERLRNEMNDLKSQRDFAIHQAETSKKSKDEIVLELGKELNRLRKANTPI